MKKTITATYGRWNWSEENDVIAFTSENRINDPDYIKYGQVEIEIEIPSKQEQNLAEIRNLNEAITKVRANSQRNIEILEEEIQKLMALEE